VTAIPSARPATPITQRHDADVGRDSDDDAGDEDHLHGRDRSSVPAQARRQFVDRNELLGGKRARRHTVSRLRRPARSRRVPSVTDTDEPDEQAGVEARSVPAKVARRRMWPVGQHLGLGQRVRQGEWPACSRDRRERADRAFDASTPRPNQHCAWQVDRARRARVGQGSETAERWHRRSARSTDVYPDELRRTGRTGSPTGVTLTNAPVGSTNSLVRSFVWRCRNSSTGVDALVGAAERLRSTSAPSMVPEAGSLSRMRSSRRLGVFSGSGSHHLLRRSAAGDPLQLLGQHVGRARLREQQDRERMVGP
jgi:hypothetical protein